MVNDKAILIQLRRAPAEETTNAVFTEVAQGDYVDVVRLVEESGAHVSSGGIGK